MRIVLMGPPGAGKGTQAERLVERFSMTHLSSGDIFRAEKASNSPLGQKLAEYMSRGELVPDDVVVEMMAKAIASVEGGLLLDGFPRTVAQAESLDKTLSERDLSLDAVILITAPDDMIVSRITGRRSCPECKKGFHVEFLPSSKGELCDACEEDVELVLREDDSEEVVRQRLDAYRNQTEPVINYYRQAGAVRIIEVDGTPPPDEVADKIADHLEAC